MPPEDIHRPVQIGPRPRSIHLGIRLPAGSLSVVLLPQSRGAGNQRMVAVGREPAYRRIVSLWSSPSASRQARSFVITQRPQGPCGIAPSELFECNCYCRLRVGVIAANRLPESRKELRRSCIWRFCRLLAGKAFRSSKETAEVRDLESSSVISN